MAMAARAFFALPYNTDNYIDLERASRQCHFRGLELSLLSQQGREVLLLKCLFNPQILRLPPHGPQPIRPISAAASHHIRRELTKQVDVLRLRNRAGVGRGDSTRLVEALPNNSADLTPCNLAAFAEEVGILELGVGICSALNPVKDLDVGLRKFN